MAIPAIANATMPQSRSAKSSGVPLKCRHGKLVENRFTRKRIQFGNEMKAWGIPQEPGLHLIR